MQSSKRLVIGIFAGVGTGKSSILKILEDEYAADIIRADDVAHMLYAEDEGLAAAMRKLLGDKIFDEKMNIDRAKVATLIFSDKKLLKKLDSLVHPRVWSYISEYIEKSDSDLLVVEAAVLPDNASVFDELWFIKVDEKLRRERLKLSRAYSDEKITSIIAVQADENEYSKIADRIIENNMSLAELSAEIAGIMEELNIKRSK